MTAEQREDKSLMEEIEKWRPLVQERGEFLEIAFFKIFVKFERLILDLIIQYSTGQYSSEEYLPERRLEFEDFEHLKNTITDKKHIDISNRMDKLVTQIFRDNNPFSFFFNSEDRDFYNRMKYLRNYIAHESPESRNAYKKNVLFNQEYISPSTFLAKRHSRENPASNYTIFIDLVQKYSNSFLKNPNE